MIDKNPLYRYYILFIVYCASLQNMNRIPQYPGCLSSCNEKENWILIINRISVYTTIYCTTLKTIEKNRAALTFHYVKPFTLHLTLDLQKHSNTDIWTRSLYLLTTDSFSMFSVLTHTIRFLFRKYIFVFYCH